MKSKHCKLPSFPPKIKAALYKRQIDKAYTYIEKSYSLLSIFPSPNFTYILKLKEAYYSLSTQGIDLSLEKVCELKYKNDSASVIVKRIDSYLQAIEYIEHLSKEEYATKGFWQKLHSLAEKEFFKVHEEIGCIRTKQNWIGPKNCTAEEAFFFPPPPEMVPQLMDRLKNYLDEEVEPHLQLGIGFAQFLLIHPFMDGNGRVARLFAAAHIKQKGLLKQPLLFLSQYFLEHRMTYLKRLFILTFDRQWRAWLNFYFKALEVESYRMYRKIKTLTSLYLSMRSLLTYLCPGREDALLMYLFEHPVFSLEGLQSHTQISYALLTKAIKKMQNQQLIRKNKEEYFVFLALLQIGQKK